MRYHLIPLEWEIFFKKTVNNNIGKDVEMLQLLSTVNGNVKMVENSMFLKNENQNYHMILLSTPLGVCLLFRSGIAGSYDNSGFHF